MACGVLAVFWLSFGMLQLPTLNLAEPYTATDGGPAGTLSIAFNAVIALYLIVWGFAILTFLILSVKTNLVFMSIFLFVTAGAWILSGAYWKLSTGDYSGAETLQKAGGAIIFVAGVLAWYMTVAMMSAEMQFSVCLPVGDLGRFWTKSGTETRSAEDEA
ncbi:uncharacterized protein A1O9_06015 [Exophiala aquamarina CBS 119918]|uniref:MARVEL domain-containing protein n=1 Tax=Exophiala aquamarina CBS 119918 TaxID=1182545 RepID=A0A072PE90_9EURO|nr:uncharacterized protein A1O9_06015 [Exophiala aquamarina CBS 119918]KEF58092.1 hypothetical protein A1O9_06015 [Exophiala aquamarina CBS 119918]